MNYKKTRKIDTRNQKLRFLKRVKGKREEEMV
jgi:hypothetical protein